MILVWLIPNYPRPFIAGLLSWRAEPRFGQCASPALNRAFPETRLPHEGRA